MNSKSERLGTEKISKLVFSLAIPAVMAQLINMLYNIVDRIYIGNMPTDGRLALTGLGVAFPLLMIISAFSAFVGMGGAPLAAIKMGEGDHEGAEKILGNSITLLLSMSVILFVVFNIFKIPLLNLFGASPDTMPFTNAYVSIYLFGTPFVLLALGLNTFISCQGFAKTAMFSVLIGAIANIVLDPILIFVFDMGVQGAALATIISQMLSAIWVVRFLLVGNSGLKIKWKNMAPDWSVIGKTATLGISPFIMQSTESLVQIVFNTGLLKYGGDLYVGSMTIILSVMQLIVMPVSGFAQGAQPIISYNYGARNNKRVMETFKLVLKVSLTFATLGMLATMLVPELFARLFGKDAALIELTSKIMPIFMSGVFLFGAQLACQNTFLALGQAKISIFLALLRKIILLVPLAIILPTRFGVMGIYYAEPIADIIAALTAITLFTLNIKKILAKNQ